MKVVFRTSLKFSCIILLLANLEMRFSLHLPFLRHFELSSELDQRLKNLTLIYLIQEISFRHVMFILDLTYNLVHEIKT